MTRRMFVCFAALATCLGPLGLTNSADAQQAGKVYRIGTLTVSPAERASHLLTAFEESLGRLGYTKGANVVYEHRFADGRTERLP